MSKSTIDTITRSYPERVMDMDGKQVRIGVDVTLPADQVRRFEQRWDLEPVKNPVSKSSKKD